jgi:hypothetical protein
LCVDVSDLLLWLLLRGHACDHLLLRLLLHVLLLLMMINILRLSAGRCRAGIHNLHRRLLLLLLLGLLRSLLHVRRGILNHLRLLLWRLCVHNLLLLRCRSIAAGSRLLLCVHHLHTLRGRTLHILHSLLLLLLLLGRRW